ncbi:alanine dehydrogenase [Thermophagus xiamenensis]|uniref:alanine dehydrogenase n=2 Tax=Thermophagus xiamenensis TaxID=385682 RepID=A0A1I1YBU1_9BACT|nr:alanine dehydrogenase [Thermophagus xiamenensis]SFE15360.1 alanine dehydrogenase [Thermophagus xiamenensis]
MGDIGKSASQYFAINQTGLMPKEELLEIGKGQKSMSFGIPREHEKGENRIPLTPQGVELLTANGHEIVIESGAGNGANYFDHDFSEAGAKIVDNHEEPFRCDVVLKVAPPNEEERQLFSPGQLLISLLHIFKQDRESIQQLMHKKINALAYEFLKDESNCYPVIRSMSEIEGYTAIMIASEYLSKEKNGKGVLLGGITGISPAEVVVIGAGTAGEFAVRAALGLGCQVKVFDNSYRNLRELERNVGQRLFTSVLHPQVLSKALKSADAVISSLRYFDPQSRFFISEEQIAGMKPGSIIVDLSMGNGGCFDAGCSSKSHGSAVTIQHGVIHYRVHNIASRVARTASIALSNIFAPVLLRLAMSGGVSQLIKQDLGVSHGLYLYKGILTNHTLGERFNLPSKDIGLLMAAF